MPPDRRPWTHDIYRASRRLAMETRAALVDRGLDKATYVAGGDGLDVRRDLGTLNLSDVPTVMVELGNMRNPWDAAQMTRPGGRDRYARALGLAVLATWTPEDDPTNSRDLRVTRCPNGYGSLEHPRACAAPELRIA